MQTTSSRQTGDRRAGWRHPVVTALLFLPIAVGLMLPWESGYQWSSPGWEVAAGRALAVVAFLVAWTFVIYLADGLGEGWNLLALMLLALSAVGISGAFYMLEIGSRDDRVADGFFAIRAGSGLAVTFFGGLVLGADVIFQWRDRRVGAQIP